MTNDVQVRSDALIRRLNDALNGFAWGCFYGGADHQDEPGCWETYRVLAPDEFLRLRGGCCWDYVVFQTEFFRRLLPTHPVRCWYWENDRDENHTWLTFGRPGDDRVHLFESSYKAHAGITVYPSAARMVAAYAALLDGDHHADGWTVFEYTNPQQAVGLDAWQFMRWVHRTGRAALTTGNHLARRCTPPCA